MLRGIAVMGIFSVNVVSFAMPEAAYLNPAAYGGSTGSNLALWAANFLLVDNKMRTLFSALFGASLLLVVERAEAAGRSGAAVHYRRMAWLLLFGLAHFYGIWSGDILSLYAPVGMAAFAFRKAPVERLLAAALLFLLLYAAWIGAVLQSIAAGGTEGLVRPGAAELARDLAVFRGSWPAIAAHRLHDETFAPLLNLIALGPHTLGLMLLGMAGLKSGFLTGEWPAASYRRVAAVCVGVGLAGHAAIAAWTWHTGFAPTAVFAGYYLLALPFYLVQAGGYAALAMLLTQRGGALATRLAAAGRAAFTNYLGSSLIAATIFYGYGLGLYGRVDRLHAWLLVPLVWALILLWSKPWLARCRYGPFEWAWRSLARWRWEPIRR